MTAAQNDLHDATSRSTAPSGSAPVRDLTDPGVATPGWDVQVARPQDQSRILATLSLAFSTDPANRWMYPSPESYLRHFPAFVMALGGRAFEVGTAYFIGDVQAAALWLPPNVGPDETALMALIRRTLSDKKQEELAAIVKEMGHYHPDEPHWYLPWVGVDPSLHHRGYGSALLDHGLRFPDHEGVPAYLEASSLESIPLYKRHGFEVLGTIQVGTAPPVTPMIRRPR